MMGARTPRKQTTMEDTSPKLPKTEASGLRPLVWNSGTLERKDSDQKHPGQIWRPPDLGTRSIHGQPEGISINTGRSWVLETECSRAERTWEVSVSRFFPASFLRLSLLFYFPFLHLQLKTVPCTPMPDAY